MLKFHNGMSMLNKKPMDYETGYPLYKSEIHTIDFIGRHPELNISELAEEMGITKSAVSQIITKLNQKKLIMKKRYKKEVLVFLTEEGVRAFNGHKKYHETQNQYSVFKKTEKYTPETKRLIADFISDYINDLPKY
jgi:DNA-binding MarR family transcriptional regulator